MNKLKLFFAVFFTVLTLTNSKPSQAVVSLATGGTAIAGLAIMGGGVALTYVALKTCPSECAPVLLLPLFSGALGLIVLEGEQTVGFRPLNSVEATKIGLSQEEILSFHEELDQANMLLSDVSVEMSKITEPTAQDSANAWNSVKDLVSPATFSAMIKIASQN